MATDKTDDLLISISTDVATLRRGLKRLETEINASNSNVQRQYAKLGKDIDGAYVRATRNAETALTRLGRASTDAYGKFAKVFAVAASARGAQTLIDSSTKIQNSLKVAGLEGENLKSVYDSLFASAQRNGVPVAELVTLYGRAATAAKELGASQNDLKNFSETVAMSLKAGGGSAAEASGAMLQLGQAIGGGKVQMEEYGSLLDGARPLLQAVAAGIDEAGGSVSKLTTLVKDGKLSSKAFFDGAIAGAPLLAKTLSTSEETISSRFVRLQNVLTDAAGKFDRGVEAGNAFGEALDTISTEIGQVNFDQLSTQLKSIAETLSGGAASLKSWADSIGKISGLRNIGSSILPEGGLSFFGGALTINSTVTPEKLAVEAAEKRLSIEKQIAELRNQPSSPDVDRSITKLETQLSSLPAPPKRQPGITRPVYDLPGGSPLPAKEVKPVKLADYPVDDAAQTEKLKNAYRDLMKSADDRIGQMRQEVELLGKYGIEAETARFKLDLLQNSEDKGRSLSEEQRKELEKKVALYKQYAETLAKAKLSQDLLDERRLKSMSKTEQNVYQTLGEYGLPKDLDSDEAKKIRQAINTNAVADGIDSFLTDFSSALQQNGGDIGKAFGDSIKKASIEAMNDALGSLFKQISNAVASALFSGGGAAGSGAGVAGVGAGIVGAVASSAFSGTAPVGAVTRMALPDAGVTETGISLSGITAASGLTAKVASEYAPRFQGLLNDLDKAGYSIKSLGEGGYKFRFVDGTNNLSKHSFGEALDINPGQNPWSDRLQTNLPSNIDTLAKQNGLIWGGTWNKPDAMHFQVDKTANAASDALKELASSSGSATVGLDKLGQLSTNIFPPAPAAPTGGGGGGLFSWLGGLFGGGLSAADVAKYTPMVGLFADGGVINGPGSGTSDSIPTMLSNEEFIVNARQSKKHRALLHAINNGTIGHMASGGVVRQVSAPVAPELRARGSAANDNNRQPGILQVHISGANGDDHVRMLVRQGVGEGLSQYNDDQRRGGFGTMQSRFGNQKV